MCYRQDTGGSGWKEHGGSTHRAHTKPTPNAWEQGGPVQRGFKQDSTIEHFSACLHCMHELCMHAPLPSHGAAQPRVPIQAVRRSASVECTTSGGLEYVSIPAMRGTAKVFDGWVPEGEFK